MTDRQRLTSQVTLRLDEELASSLREFAEQRGVKYTSLLREWIETMYDATSSGTSSWVHVESGGESGGHEGRNPEVDAQMAAAS